MQSNQKHTFDNGDVLVCELRHNVHFAGFQPANLWVVYYGERSPSDDENGRSAYNVWHSEHYLDTPDGRIMAAYAYRDRLSAPFKASKYAMAIEHLGIPRA